ncbi:polysaccharide lyase family 7 protein [Formosa sp. 4Alg 33]|uniref:polysaccharide lyase family 7 protein n=1 Tax=Formosa sp. 4Alg 33 TaxID=3382189 RepID=UPI003D9C4568
MKTNYTNRLQILILLILFSNFGSHLWAQIPADLMENCKQWKITYPTGEEEKKLCDEPNNEFFFVNDDKDAIVFRTPIRTDNGTTPNSDNVRSELREREPDGSADVYWTTEGSHMLYVKQAITHLPINKSELVATQIHGDKEAGIDDAMVLRLEDSHLFLSFNGGKLRSDISITNTYTLGTIHEVIFLVQDNKHYCYYSEDGSLLEAFNNNTASDYLVKDGDRDYVMDLEYDQSYFKVGNYTQSNPKDEGDDTGKPENYGEVLVYDFSVVHDEIEVSGVSLSPSNIELSIGGPFQLTKTISPAHATNKTVTYSTSDASVVEVNSSGVITGKSAGTAVITVTTVDGGFTATSYVTVLEDAVGTNLALKKEIKGTGTHDADNKVENLVDGSTATRWSVSGFPQTATIDLGQVYAIGRSEVVCYSDRAYQYTISVSDTENGTYTEIVDRSENTTPGDEGNPIVNVFAPVEGRFVKLTVTGAAVYDGSWVSMSEFRLFEASALGIEDAPLDERNIVLSPNPARNAISFSGAEGFNNIKIYDHVGKLIVNQSYNGQSVDVSHLNSGLYIVRLSGTSKTVNKRMIKK